jgi:fucose permease
VPYAAYLISWIIDWAAVPVGVFAFVHALLQKSEAYTAADRMTKQAWVGITIGGTLAVWLFSFYKSTSMLWIAGLVAVLVYIVDVRPKLNEVQRGKRW